MPMVPIDPSADPALPAPPARWGSARVRVTTALLGESTVQVARLAGPWVAVVEPNR